MMNTKDKKILIITGGCVFIIFLCWALVYSNANKKLKVLKSELDFIKKDLDEIKLRGGKDGQDTARMIGSLKKDFEAAMRKLPPKEGEGLRFISGEANRLSIDVVSIQPEPKKASLDADNNPIFLEGRQLFEVPISIDMRGTYKDIGEYLGVLREGPALIKAQEIVIDKDEAISPKLRVRLALIIYILP